MKADMPQAASRRWVSPLGLILIAALLIPSCAVLREPLRGLPRLLARLKFSAERSAGPLRPDVCVGRNRSTDGLSLSAAFSPDICPAGHVAVQSGWIRLVRAQSCRARLYAASDPFDDGEEVENKVLLWTATFLISAPYLIEEFHYGNVHFFIVFLTVLALFFFETGRETLSAAVLALAISIKVFPVFFLPYFLIQRKFRYVALTLLCVASVQPSSRLLFRIQAEHRTP